MLTKKQVAQIRELKREGRSIKEIADAVGCSPPSVCRYTKRMRAARVSPNGDFSLSAEHVKLVARLSAKEIEMLADMVQKGILP